MIKLLRLRYLLFLALIYLLLVSLLYHYLWQARALDRIFEGPSPRRNSAGRGQYAVVGADVVFYDDERDSERGEDRVEFNFRRNPSRQGVKVYNGYGKARNRSRADSETSHSRHAPPRTSKVNTTTLQRNPPPSLHEEEKIAQMNNLTHSNGNLTKYLPNPCLHAFYYAWYGNPRIEGKYMHWNHHYLPHWVERVAKHFPTGRHIPPKDIGASFYPQLGCYSSKDPNVIATHMRQLREARVGVMAVSWYPAGLSDDEGPPPDQVIPVLLDSALVHGIKVVLHIEPYKNRTPQSVRKDLVYIHAHYSGHSAMYAIHHKTSLSGRTRRPLVYIYDSYLSPVHEWAKVLAADGELTIRGKEYDVVAIALLVEQKHAQSIVEGGFDGFYTYFAANRFSYGSTLQNWENLANFAKQKDLLFIPSFGPGYDDLQVRPWNKKTSQGRKGGEYYREGFAAALASRVGGMVSITSFNEWGEGTQIEPAVEMKREGYTYLDYTPHGPGFYLELTREFSWQLDCGIT